MGRSPNKLAALKAPLYLRVRGLAYICYMRDTSSDQMSTQPRSGGMQSIPVHNPFLDWVMPVLKEAELKIYIYLLYAGVSTPAELLHGKEGDRGTGLSRGSLSPSIKSLKERGLLSECRTGSGDLAYVAVKSASETMDKPDLKHFPGFRKLAGYTELPGELHALLPDLSGGQLKVLLFLLRQTTGSGREAVALSKPEMTQGMRGRDGKPLNLGTGCSEPTVNGALAKLEAYGLVRVERRTSEQKASLSSVFSLRYMK